MTPYEAVTDYVRRQTGVNQYCIAYSGGMDSHVLLLLMSQLQQEQPSIHVRAVHVDHGLQSDSAQWAEHAQLTCDSLAIPLEIRRASVATDDDGPEAAARNARYKQFEAVLLDDEHLLLAQHAEDQAETFLLQALRGSGLDGLSGIPRKRRFAGGYLGRPLLSCDKKSLQALAKQHELEWIEDPSNADDRFDRNYLRQHVMPLLNARWPASAQTLGRSSQRCVAASQTLFGLAQQDLNTASIPGTQQLSIEQLGKMPKERAYAALRLLIRQRGFRMPRLQDLVQVMSDLVDARPDSQGIVNVRDYIFRRHKDQLYLLPPQVGTQSYCYTWSAPFEPLVISEAGVTLSRAACLLKGIKLPTSGSLTVRSREGGELIKLGEPAFHKSVKKILQESSVPPWTRDEIPLIYAQEKLVAVWGVAVSVEYKLGSVETKRQDSHSGEKKAQSQSLV